MFDVFDRYSGYVPLKHKYGRIIYPRVSSAQLSSPNRVFEAMTYGLPPVITNMEPILVNEEFGCGIVVDYDNTGQIKGAVVCLIDKTELRRRLSKNDRKALLQKYNWTHETHIIKNLLRMANKMKYWSLQLSYLEIITLIPLFLNVYAKECNSYMR
ncbi:MAG TPA: hypothetical protein VKA91_08455 [Nitrososphaeraceae archaeon]|nr:hypothetical protein [Nitrososphaeraceae archaeon]